MKKPHKKARPNALGEAVRPGASPPLGIYPRSVDSQDAEEQEKAKEIRRIASRRQLYADLKATAFILLSEMPGKRHSITKCRWTKVAPSVTLHLMDVGNRQLRAALKGVKVCGNVWGCPVCSARISQTRRAEMNTLLAWSRKNGFIPIMLTLTARHGREDKIADLLDSMKKAKQRLRQRGEWRRLPFVGSVTATEVTHGRVNGWHPHFHEIVLLAAEDEAEALAMVAPLGHAWRASLRAFGLDGAAAAFDAQGAGSAGDYVAKWGVAEELTLTGSKRGKAGKGRSPRELVRLADGGDDEARDLWMQYFRATSVRRRRQLVWSPGLKAQCGVTDVADEEAAEAESAEEDDQIAEYDNEGWRRVRTKRVLLMEAAERGGSSAVRLAEAGPDDADPEPPSEVIDCECDEPGHAQGDTSDDDLKSAHMSDPHCSVPKIRAGNGAIYDDSSRWVGTPGYALTEGTPPPPADCAFLNSDQTGGLVAVRADDIGEDRENDQLNHDVVQDRREGVQHRISEML